MTDTEHALSLLPDGWFTAAEVMDCVRTEVLWELEDKGLLAVSRSECIGVDRMHRKTHNDKQE